MDSSSFSVSSVVKDGNIDIPKKLCTLIQSVKNDASTWDEVMEGLRDYIWERRLFDPQQMKVLCKGDALEEIVGVQEFTILEIKKLLEGFVFRLHSNEVLEKPPETISKDTPPIPYQETTKRKAKEELPEGTKGAEKRHCFGHVECPESMHCAHLKSAASPMLLHIPPSPVGALESASDSSESVQDVETSFVVDSSDDSIYFDEDTHREGPFLPSGSILTIAETFEVEFEPNSETDSLYSDSDASDGWESIMDLDSIITFVCKTDDDQEFWADKSSDEDPDFCWDKSSDEDFDAEISEFDLWRCSSCMRLNNPKNRFCLKCFGMREGWLPEKLALEKIPHPTKRKPRLKRKKRFRNDSSKFFKEDSSQSLGLPSTSKEKSPSHEDFDLDKNTISLSPSPKISDHKQNSEKKICLVCCDKPVDSCIIHGKLGHAICCYRCAKRFKRCPICRRMIEKVVYQIS